MVKEDGTVWANNDIGVRWATCHFDDGYECLSDES